jgi:hypothetical protein
LGEINVNYEPIGLMAFHTKRCIAVALCGGVGGCGAIVFDRVAHTEWHIHLGMTDKIVKDHINGSH